MEAVKAMIRERLQGDPRVAQTVEERPELRDDPVGLLKYLEEQGLVEDIFAFVERGLRQMPPTLVAERPPEQKASILADAISSASWQLRLRLLGGRVFLDFLDESDCVGRELRWHLAFGTQRRRSRPVAAAVDMTFEEAFFLPLPGSCGSRTSLLQHTAQLHLVLTCRDGSEGGYWAREDPPWDTGTGSLLCSQKLEWRHCLASAGPTKLTVELQGVGRRHQIPVGVLHAEIELLPTGSAASVLPEVSVGAQLRVEDQRRAEVMRKTFEDLDRWWSEHHELYPGRHIRLFAQTESCLFFAFALLPCPA